MNFLSGLFRGTRSLSGGVMRSMPNVGSINEKHHVSGNHMFDFPEDKKSLIFGMGCFWGVERLFWKQPGVWSTQGKYFVNIKIARTNLLWTAMYRQF
jgi:hypothetical protein